MQSRVDLSSNKFRYFFLFVLFIPSFRCLITQDDDQIVKYELTLILNGSMVAREKLLQKGHNIVKRSNHFRDYNKSSDVDMYGVVGGNVVKSITEYPWAAALTYSRMYHCSGTIISPWHVLSAAHCAHKNDGAVLDPLKFRIVTGLLKHNEYIAYPDSRNWVKHVYISPSYVPRRDSYIGDIAIFETENEIKVDNVTRKIATLPWMAARNPKNLLRADVSCRTSGWGPKNVTRDVFSRKQRLITIDLPTINSHLCSPILRVFLPVEFVENKDQFCTFDPNGGSGCTGDSGSGLICGDEAAIVGVVSQAEHCNYENTAAIWSNVMAKRNFIENVLQGRFEPTPFGYNVSSSNHLKFMFNLNLLLTTINIVFI